MANLEIYKILITVIIAALGWIAAHYFNSKRDRALKRRELITTHLINAYRILANDVSHREASFDGDLKLETVLVELQLFGSGKQIHLTKELIVDIAKGGEFCMDDLLNGLRKELRKELNLSPVEGNIKYLRINRNKIDKNER